MINYHTSLVSALEEVGLPVQYEMFLTSGTSLPCISYMEVNNAATMEGDTLGYSRIQYQISIWDKSIGTIQGYVTQVDSALRELGFKRISSNEMSNAEQSIIRKILTYECLALEQFI